MLRLLVLSATILVGACSSGTGPSPPVASGQGADAAVSASDVAGHAAPADAAPADAEAADGVRLVDAAVDASAAVDAAPDTVPKGMATVARAPLVQDAGTSAPFRLAQTGLYADIERKVLASDVLEFEPAHRLWSDGTDKRRWIVLPAGTKIDTSEMNNWVFPVGTRMWKEFSKGGRRLETRLIVRTGPERMDYWMGAFLWNEAETDATFVPDGAKDVLATDHDVPEAKKCWTCHQGEPGRILGFSAVQLSRDDRQPSLTWLAEQGWLSHPPPAGATYPAPGEGAVKAALGYLHANCGHCHNSWGVARPDADHILKLAVEERAPETTAIYRTSIGVKLQKFRDPAVSLRLVPGKPYESAIFHRMNRRGGDVQMPPLATKHVDALGTDIIRVWIEALN